MVNAEALQARVWSIDLLLRAGASGAGVLVFACARGLSTSDTRRLQLAAGAGGGLCILARPERELRSLSAASTRWRVEPAFSPRERPRWTVTLVRDKDRPLTDERASWVVELGTDEHGASHLVDIPAIPGVGSGAAVGVGARVAS